MKAKLWLPSLAAAALLGAVLGWGSTAPRSVQPAAPAAAAKPPGTLRSAEEWWRARRDGRWPGPEESWPALSQLPADELARAIAQAPPGEHLETLHHAFRCLAGVAPVDALRLAAVRSDHYHAALRVVLAALRPQGPAAVERWIAQLAAPSRTHAEAAWCSQLLATGEHAAAWDFAVGKDCFDARLDELIRAFADVSPSEALRRAEALPNGSRRARAILVAVAHWAKSAPGAALHWVLARPALAGREQLLETVFRAAAESDPRSVLEAGPQLPRASRRLLNHWVGIWSVKDLAAARAWLAALPEAARLEWMVPVISTWAARDPAAALAFVSSQPPSEQTKQAATLALQGLARKDPAAARAVLQAMPPGILRVGALHGLLSSSGQSSPEASEQSLRLLPGLPGGASSEEWMVAEGALMTWATRQLDAALAWLETAPPDSRNFLRSGLIWRLVGTDPARIAGLVTQAAAATPTADYAPAFDRVASNWAAKDPVAATQWGLSLSDPDLREQVLRSALRMWTQRDPAAAQEWRQANPGRWNEENPRPR